MVSLQCDGDNFIMNVAQGTTAELRSIQRCRVYMKAATLADVFIADGESLKESLVIGVPFVSKIDWPRQQRPPPSDWNV